MEAATETYYSTPQPGKSLSTGGFDIRQPIRVVCLRLKWIPPIVLASLVFGILAAFFWPPTYEAATIVKKSSQTSDGGNQLLDGQVDVPYPGAGDPGGNFLAIALSENVLHRIMAMLSPGPDNPDFRGMSPGEIQMKLRRMITISPIGSSDLISFEARS